MLRALRFAAIACTIAALFACSSQSESPQPSGLPVPTGHFIDSGRVTQALGGFPCNIVLSPDGRFAFTTDAGGHRALHALDTATGASVSRVDYSARRPRQPAGEAATQPAGPSPRSTTLYYGLAAGEHVLYAAEGGGDAIAVLSVSDAGQLTPLATIATRRGDFPAGLALDKHGHLFVANQVAGGRGIDTPFSPASVAIYDTATQKEIGRYTFKDSFFSTSNFPLAIAASADGKRAYVASERDSALYILDTSNPESPALLATLPTGAHPQGIRLSRDERILCIANADSDTLTVVDTAANKVIDTILLRPAVAKDLPGCTPLGLCFSKDGHFVYVTLADINAIAVVDLKDSEVDGYIPTAWYPSSVVLTPDGTHLLVTNARGAAPRVPNNAARNGRGESPLNLLDGVAQRLDIPDRTTLRALSQKVLNNNQFDRLDLGKNPLQSISRQAGGITHILYIIKENRTYDQVLGDMPQGNGDKSLCLFGKDITPNQHALAERFVLLDNLYACGEVSGDGWCWSTQSIANAYVARNVPYHYMQRGRKFDFEGQNNGYPTGGFPATGPDGKPLSTAPAFKDGAKPIPDVATGGGGYLWDLCAKHGVTFRNYGFFGSFADDTAGFASAPENYPSVKGLQPAGHNLAGLTDIDFRRFDVDYADSDAPAILFKQTGDSAHLYATTKYGKFDSPSRFSEWNREFQLMLQKDASGKAVPNLMFLRIPCDHTSGARSGKHSPAGMVADNDYAVGQIVQAVSHSPIWEHCAIFIIEDDAQAGADHVDAHRTTGFVISPYIKQSTVDHRFYNTNSFLRTIELLLNLSPLTQYDATATPVLAWAEKPANASAYEAIMPEAKVFAQRNIGADEAAIASRAFYAKLAARSDKMDFTHADAAPSEELNAIIWQVTRGPLSPPPAPRNAGDGD